MKESLGRSQSARATCATHVLWHAWAPPSGPSCPPISSSNKQSNRSPHGPYFTPLPPCPSDAEYIDSGTLPRKAVDDCNNSIYSWYTLTQVWSEKTLRYWLKKNFQGLKELRHTIEERRSILTWTHTTTTSKEDTHEGVETDKSFWIWAKSVIWLTRRETKMTRYCPISRRREQFDSRLVSFRPESLKERMQVLVWLLKKIFFYSDFLPWTRRLQSYRWPFSAREPWYREPESGANKIIKPNWLFANLAS